MLANEEWGAVQPVTFVAVDDAAAVLQRRIASAVETAAGGHYFVAAVAVDDAAKEAVRWLADTCEAV